MTDNLYDLDIESNKKHSHPGYLRSSHFRKLGVSIGSVILIVAAVYWCLLLIPRLGEINTGAVDISVSPNSRNEDIVGGSVTPSGDEIAVLKNSGSNTNGRELITSDSSINLNVPNTKLDPDQKLREDFSKNKKVAPPGQVINNYYHDYSSARSKFDASAEFKAIVTLSPVIVFTWDNPKILMDALGTNYQQESQGLLKTLGQNYQITPVASFVSLDRHPHYKELAEYINQLYQKVDTGSTSAKTINDRSMSTNAFNLPRLEPQENILPGIVIAGKPIGNARQLKAAHESGQLLGILKELGKGIINVERVG